MEGKKEQRVQSEERRAKTQRREATEQNRKFVFFWVIIMYLVTYRERYLVMHKEFGEGVVYY